MMQGRSRRLFKWSSSTAYRAFFRDLVQGAMYQKTLKKAGVQLFSITQQTQNDPSGSY